MIYKLIYNQIIVYDTNKLFIPLKQVKNLKKGTRIRKNKQPGPIFAEKRQKQRQRFKETR